MAGKRDQPGGKPAARDTYRVQSRGFRIWLSDERFRKLAALATAEGLSRNALIERWIDEHDVPLPAAPVTPE